MSEPTKTVIYHHANHDARQRRTVRAFAKRKRLEVIKELEGTGLGPWTDELNDALICFGWESVAVVVIHDASALADSTLDQIIAVLALEARDVRVLVATTGQNLTKAANPIGKATHDIALRYGLFERLHQLRLNETQRQVGQATWRQMAATRRASAAQAAL